MFSLLSSLLLFSQTVAIDTRGALFTALRRNSLVLCSSPLTCLLLKMNIKVKSN
jgi:hypothetical protein